MSLAKLQNLMFKIDLLDRVSKPIGGIMKTMDKMSNKIQGGYQKMGTGVAGVVGAGYLLNDILAPTKEMNKALGEVRSLSVAEDVLSSLSKTGLDFSTQYGESASAFVRSSYDIQSAISGLVGNELPAFTYASNVLAKGTKADAATMTSYVGTMYGIFEKNATAMGKANWINELAGQTATAVKLFKTTGQGMSDAFTTIGAAGQTNGIAMSEQIAILGTLQATMSGSEAGTKYRSFLDNVGKAQKELNLKFVDAKGKMLPLVDILRKINTQYGQIDTVAKSDLIKKAFGTDEAVAMIKLLSGNIDGLQANIEAVGQVNGLQPAIDMANAMADPWDRVSSGITAVKTSFGSTLVPMLLPYLDGINKTVVSIMKWIETYPNLAKAMGIVTLGLIMGLAALGAIQIAVGYWAAVTGGATLLLEGMLIPLWAWVRALWAGAIPAIQAFSAALWANPITWWVVGILALIAIVAAAIIYWDEWTQAVIKFAAAFLEWTGIFAIIDSVIAFLDKIPAWFAQFKAWLSNLNPFEALLSGIDFVVGKLNALTGFNIDMGHAPIAIAPGTAPISTAPQPNTGKGGIGKQMSSIMFQNKSSNLGGVTVNNYGHPMSGAKLRDELLFAS